MGVFKPFAESFSEETAALHTRERETLYRERIFAPWKFKAVAPGSIAPEWRNRIIHEVRDDLIRGAEAVSCAVGRARGVAVDSGIWRQPETFREAYERVRAQAQNKEIEGRPGFFSEAFAREGMTMDDVEPLRALVAYRIVREHCRSKSLIPDDQTLVQALGPRDHPGLEDPWRSPDVRTSFGKKHVGSIMVGSLAAASFAAGNLLQDMPLLPPAVPEFAQDVENSIERWRDPRTLEILDSYDFLNDREYERWLHGIRSIAAYLRIAEGSNTNKNLGIYGLAGLIEPECARLFWPSRYEIYAVEERLIEEALNIQVKESAGRAVQKMVDKYGFVEFEAVAICRLGKARAKTLMSADFEEERAIMLLRLDDYIARAKDSLNLTAEMHALKLMTLIHGFARKKGEDVLTELLSAVQAVSARRAGRPVVAELEVASDSKVIDAITSSEEIPGANGASRAFYFADKKETP